MAGSIIITMLFGVAVYLITGSHLLAGVTGFIGGVSYSRSLRAS
jgi:hypothetical protein